MRNKSPVKAAAEITVHDFNGTGAWSRDALLRRYAEYTRRFRVVAPRDLSPSIIEHGNVRWVYPVMLPVIDAMEAGDKAALEIGVEFIEQDAHFAFGKILKSNAARALRRAHGRGELSGDQQERIRRRVVQMLLDGHVPHEFKEYAKLLRGVGYADDWARIEAECRNANRYVRRWYHYFRQHHEAHTDR